MAAGPAKPAPQEQRRAGLARLKVWKARAEAKRASSSTMANVYQVIHQLPGLEWACKWGGGEPGGREPGWPGAG